MPGWCDKYAALLSTRNPVAGPHFNFSSAEPMGVVVVAAPDRPALLGLVSVLACRRSLPETPSSRSPRNSIRARRSSFAEALATSDIPAGVVNMLTGYRDEIVPVMAKHMDVNAIVVPHGDPQLREIVERDAAENVKRVRTYPARSRDEWFAPAAQSLDDIAIVLRNQDHLASRGHVTEERAREALVDLRTPPVETPSSHRYRAGI